MNEQHWTTWQIQTSRSVEDMNGVLAYTNIDMIDYDHQILVRYAIKLNQLIEKSQKSMSIAIIKETKELLNDLYRYAEEHFIREEVFMDFYALPHADIHKHEHRRILEMLSLALADFHNGKAKLSNQLKYQVLEWLLNHINQYDIDFFDVNHWKDNFLKAQKWEDVSPIIHLVGIEDIDSQHQNLTIRALEGIEAIIQSRSEGVVVRVFNELTALATAHFEYEETFMETYQIKTMQDHLAKHEQFFSQLKTHRDQVLEDEHHIYQMKSWFLKWWIEHINQVDKETFKYQEWAFQLVDRAEHLEDLLKVLRKTEIDEIDTDHIRLLELTLDLNGLIKDMGSKQEDLGAQAYKQRGLDLLKEIYQYSKVHFTREEKLMVDKDLSDYKNHMEEHQLILKKLEDLQMHFNSDKLFLSANIKTMLLEWWIQHTNTMDYRTFVQHYPRD